MYYTVKTSLSGYSYFRGVTTNVEEFVKKHFSLAHYVSTFEGVIKYEYKSPMSGDIVSLTFTPHTSDVLVMVHIEGDAKFVL